MDAQRALLDELMGSARNLTEEEKKRHREVKWDDKDVCGAFMVKFCPHDLFVNTKSNLGPCPKIHDLKLKESFEKSPRHDSYAPRFEEELAQFCEKLVMDLERKLKRGRERIAQDVDVPAPVVGEKSEQLLMIEEKIRKLLEQVETLGEDGKVDEAEALMRKVDLLNAEKTAFTQQLNDKLGILPQEKKMELCEICGSFLVANDALERQHSHVTGKQHVGYGMVRDFLSEHKAAKGKAKEEQLARERKADEHKKHKEVEHESRSRENNRGSRERSRDYDRDPDEFRNRERERSRERGVGGNRDGYQSSDYRNNHYKYGREYETNKFRDRSNDGRRHQMRDRSR